MLFACPSIESFIYFYTLKTFKNTIDMVLNNFRKYILSISLLCFLFLHSFNSNGQPIITNPLAGSYFQPSFGLNMGTIFNHEDFLFDFGLGYEELGYDFSASLNGSFRPYYKTVLSKESENLYYQLQEKVFHFSIDLEKRFYFVQFMNSNKLGLYALMKLGYFYGTYKGFNENRNQSTTITPGAGFSFQFTKSSRLNLGVLYLKQNPSAAPITINLKYSLLINKNT